MDETVTSVAARRIFFFIFTPNVTMISIKIYCISELVYYEKQFFHIALSSSKRLMQAPEGLKNMPTAHPDVQIYVGHLDRCLNEAAYICPGLGDAGDRIFGTK